MPCRGRPGAWLAGRDHDFKGPQSTPTDLRSSIEPRHRASGIGGKDRGTKARTASRRGVSRRSGRVRGEERGPVAVVEVTMVAPVELDLIKHLEERLHDPAIRNAPDVVASLLAEDFLEFGRSGETYKKVDVVQSLAAERDRELSRLTAYEYELKVLSADVVLLTYRTARKRRGTSELHTLRSSIWKLTDGRWQMVFHQGTPTIRQG